MRYMRSATAILRRFAHAPRTRTREASAEFLSRAEASEWRERRYLSALAAYRSGAGLCDILSPEENRIILQTLLPEAVLSLYGASGPEETLKSAIEKASCVVVGPGSVKAIRRNVL